MALLWEPWSDGEDTAPPQTSPGLRHGRAPALTLWVSPPSWAWGATAPAPPVALALARGGGAGVTDPDSSGLGSGSGGGGWLHDPDIPSFGSSVKRQPMVSQCKRESDLPGLQRRGRAPGAGSNPVRHGKKMLGCTRRPPRGFAERRTENPLAFPGWRGNLRGQRRGWGQGPPIHLCGCRSAPGRCPAPHGRLGQPWAPRMA